jgi:tetratricopeptide (TPR) repeat protein
MAKSKKSIGGRILKWIGIVTAVISLVLGAREVVSLIREGIAQKTRAAELRVEAERLSSAGDYSRAWQSISQAVELQPDYRVTQVAVAMGWLRDIRIAPNRGERTFTEAAEKLLPVLYGAIDTSRKAYSARVLAHIGWANYLMFKEGDRSVKVDEPFKHALLLDSTNLYAHAMYGFWILYPGHGFGSIDEADRHFEAALRIGGDTNYVRHLAISAYRNASTPESQAHIISLANRMRRNHEAMDPAERQQIVTEAYYMYRGEIMDAVGTVLTTHDHLETFKYLTEGMDIDAKPYLKETLAKLKEIDGGKK